MYRRTVFFSLVMVALACSVVLWKNPGTGADKADDEFTSTTIDLGTVVSDVEKSVKFYTEAVGFKEIKGFSVPGDFASEAGLTDGQPLKIRVLVLGEGDKATKLKLMEVPAQITKSDNEFIQSQYGYRYTTIWVSDTNRALERLKKAGVTPLAKGPVPLPKGLPEGIFLTCVKDPDGNMVELVGPKK